MHNFESTTKSGTEYRRRNTRFTACGENEKLKRAVAILIKVMLLSLIVLDSSTISTL